MLINYMREAYPNFLNDPPNITDLTTFYKAAKKRFDDSEEFQEVGATIHLAYMESMSRYLCNILE